MISYKKINNKGAAFITIFLMVLLSINSNKLEGKNNYTYVGVNNCKKCHDEKIMLNQYIIWLSSPHADAVKTLTNFIV